MYTFFEITGFLSAFFKKNIETWNRDELYNSTKTSVMYIKMVNKIAEHGVSIMGKYIKLHTNDKEQKQFLFKIKNCPK